MITGGHCNEKINTTIDGVGVLIAGKYLQAYGRADLEYNFTAQDVTGITLQLMDNTGGSPDSEVENVVSFWQSVVASQLEVVIGYTENLIGRSSPEMLNMITDAWLMAIPEAQIAFTNRGGIRQDIPAGEIKIGTITGLLPFDNSILMLELSGAQIQDYLSQNWPAIGGMTTIGGYQLLDGTAIEDNQQYKVLINDYMYAASDGNNWSVIDPNPYDTSIHYRQPLIDWLESLQTSTTDLLGQYLDYTPRQ